MSSSRWPTQNKFSGIFGGFSCLIMLSSDIIFFYHLSPLCIRYGFWLLQDSCVCKCVCHCSYMYFLHFSFGSFSCLFFSYSYIFFYLFLFLLTYSLDACFIFS
ncbi:mCG1027609 [Mus musculus]|nr:mCG1027609 [Mus musculus]